MTSGFGQELYEKTRRTDKDGIPSVRGGQVRGLGPRDRGGDPDRPDRRQTWLRDPAGHPPARPRRAAGPQRLGARIERGSRADDHRRSPPPATDIPSRVARRVGLSRDRPPGSISPERMAAIEADVRRRIATRQAS